VNDINYSLRIAYNEALSGIEGVPVYYQFAPDGANDKTYIIFRGINSTDASTSNSSDTDTLITVEIHTWNDVTNSGLDADMIAKEVYNRIYPDRTTNLSIDGAQIVNTKLESDRTDDFREGSGRGMLSRYITFRHFIYHKNDLS